MDLSTRFDGLVLENPLMPAAGPLVGDAEKMLWLEKEGCDATSSETISEEAIVSEENTTEEKVEIDERYENLDLYESGVNYSDDEVDQNIPLREIEIYTLDLESILSEVSEKINEGETGETIEEVTGLLYGSGNDGADIGSEELEKEKEEDSVFNIVDVLTKLFGSAMQNNAENVEEEKGESGDEEKESLQKLYEEKNAEYITAKKRSRPALKADTD